MSRQDDNAALSEWIRERLAFFQRRVSDPESWPEMADQLLQQLIYQPHLPKTSEADMEMLSLIIHDTLSGADVRERHPEFYAKMMADPALYQMFVEAVAALQADGRHELPPIPLANPDELTFLKKAPGPQRVISQPEPGKWRVRWELLAAQVQQILFPTDHLVWRSAPLLEDESMVLLHDLITVGEQQVETILEGVRPITEPEMLRLQVTAVTDHAPPPLQATLHWGNYSATALLDTYGCAFLPPLPLADLVDEAGRLRADALHFLLEVA
jgi:hypothetical protein